jgi:hypothetical protein
LPDGTFAYHKSQFGYILESPGMENVGIFNGHFEYFTDIWNISRSFGIVFPFWSVVKEKKSLAPQIERERKGERKRSKK